MELSNAAADEQEDQSDVEIPLFQDVFRVIVLETPIVSVVVLCGLVIGHFEGWGWMDRYDNILQCFVSAPSW